MLMGLLICLSLIRYMVPGIGIRVQKINNIIIDDQQIAYTSVKVLRESHLLTGRTAILLLKPLAKHHKKPDIL